MYVRTYLMTNTFLDPNAPIARSSEVYSVSHRGQNELCNEHNNVYMRSCCHTNTGWCTHHCNHCHQCQWYQTRRHQRMLNWQGYRTSDWADCQQSFVLESSQYLAMIQHKWTQYQVDLLQRVHWWPHLCTASGNIHSLLRCNVGVLIKTYLGIHRYSSHLTAQ